ncbi:peptide/nickel transport system substrate-binding protein [Haladaptatus litoreus]|uniref:Peptide/nickel transport system substrate-binding protein n=1 Tax=Haladaptatus litoreus TaxID=553468 RepID=A0A1N7EI99_9EURY|nr:ABC transporter substrate-binding protein [Haladaptatus litoreus]SIR87774.1 peptide/nickel transport system substrate-binding protein [Haladaptatus litoreus]
METERREFMRQMGAAGASIATLSIAGCANQNNPNGSGNSANKKIEENLPQERKIGKINHVSNTEQYHPARYQANRLVDKRFREQLGANVVTDAVEITVLTSREDKGDFHLTTYNWCANNGDPDTILINRFAKGGAENDYGFNHDRYNEVARNQRKETDKDARQKLVHEAQKILGEQRVENQYLYNVYPYAYNSDRFEEDSIVVNVTGLRNIWNYTQIKPKNNKGKTIVTNNWDPSDQLNPLHINAVGPSRNWTPTRFMHDFLFRADPKQQMKPWAAKDFEWADDTTLNVNLKQGMTFHDGESVTADDVVYTFNLILETEPPAYVNYVVDTTESVEKTGNHSVRFNLTEPYAPYIAITLGLTPILPQHYWEKILSETGNESEPWKVSITNGTPVVGSGPFQWGNWDQGSRFEMPAFKNHSFAAPNIDTRIQRPLSTRDAELEAMRNGDYDLLDYWFGSPASLQDAVKNSGHLTLVENSDDCRQATWVNTKKPPFDDVAFRQAANALITGAQTVIIEELNDGFGNKAHSPINETLNFWHNPDTPYFENGVNGAIEILKDAGYVWDNDGNLYYPEGKTGA